MRIWMKAVLSAVMLSAAAPTLAQEVVVTGARRGAYLNTLDVGGGSGSRPIINLKRTADFSVQIVRITGDTRETEKRRAEIYAMIEGAIAQAAKHGVELATGDYIVEPLTLANYKNLPMLNAGRSDTDQVTFLVKVKLVPGMEAKAALERVTAYIKAVPAVGRAEMVAMGGMTLSVVSPDQYRTHIIDLIAADAAAMAAKFGPGYGVEVTGLDRPVEWARASLTEVFLYLPSTYTVRPK